MNPQILLAEEPSIEGIGIEDISSLDPCWQSLDRIALYFGNLTDK